MPRCASSNTPVRRSCAPVNAPFSCPKISLSSSVSGIAAQLIATNGNDARGLSSWIVCATSSLPVPDSPQISTDALVGAACSIDAIDAADARAVADDAAEAALLAQLAAQLLDLAQRLLPLDRLLQQDAQPRRIDRLAQVVVGAFLDRLDRGLDGALRREQDEREIGQLILQRAQQLEPAHARHDEVRHDDRGTEGGDLLHRLFAVGGFVGLKAPRADELGEPDARRGIVLDDQDALGDGRPAVRRRRLIGFCRRRHDFEV